MDYLRYNWFMRKKTNITQEDIAAFQEAVKGTKPLIQKKIRISPPRAQQPVKKKAHHTTSTFEEETETIYLSDTDRLDPVHSEEAIEYKQDGIANKILRKLRKGQYNVEAKLDLHGMSIEKARIEVTRFLLACLQDKIRVVLIIHGKGHRNQAPILKNKLNHWLREINIVLAFCSAAPKDGNRGATYVLLKRL